MSENNGRDQATIILNNKEKVNHFTELTILPNFILKWLEDQNNIIGIWNEKGKMLYVSKSVQNILGHHPDKLVGTSWRYMLSPDNLAYVREMIEKETHNCEFKLPIYNHERKTILFECTLGEVLDDKENIYYMGIFKKNHSTYKTKNMMVQSEKMTVAGQLAAGIAHEIRNPLTSLKGFLQLLQAGINQKEVYYQIMSDELDKIETITSELLFISKPLTNKRGKESIQSMINDVMVLLNSQAHIRNVNIVRKEGSDFYVYCDRSQIKQVLINIIKNAIEATDESGTVTIKVRSVHSKIEIDVIDEGPGIPEEIIHKIGEPFFTTKESGTGLGLMITKQILEQHQGKLEISRNSKKGSTFKIIIPEV